MPSWCMYLITMMDHLRSISLPAARWILLIRVFVLATDLLDLCADFGAVLGWSCRLVYGVLLALRIN